MRVVFTTESPVPMSLAENSGWLLRATIVQTDDAGDITFKHACRMMLNTLAEAEEKTPAFERKALKLLTARLLDEPTKGESK